MPIRPARALAAWAWLLGLRGCAATPGVVAVAVPVLVPASTRRDVKVPNRFRRATSGLVEQAARRQHIDLGQARRKAEAAAKEVGSLDFDAAVLEAPAAPAMAEPVALSAETAYTTPLPTDLPSIAYRFQLIQKQMFVLGNDIVAAQKNITLIDAATENSATNLRIHEANLSALVHTTMTNRKISTALEANASTSLKLVDDANHVMKGLQKQVHTLNDTAQELIQNANQLRRKVSDLNDATNEMLPGIGDVSQRMSAAKGTLKAYRETTDADFGNIVSGTLKASFGRAVRRLHEMAETAMSAKGS